MSTSKKQASFQSGPIGNKPVTDLPGIGSVAGTRLKDSGYSKASQVYGEYLVRAENKDSFQQFLKTTADVNGANSNKCYDACDQHAQQYFH